MRQDFKKQIQNRLKRVEGQVRGLQKMVEEDKYCVGIITQTSAVRRALFSVEDIILENHLSEHVIHQIKHGKEERAIKDFISL